MEKNKIEKLYLRALSHYQVYLISTDHSDWMLYNETINCIEIITDKPKSKIAATVQHMYEAIYHE